MSYRNKLANGKYDFCLIYPFLIYLCRYFTLFLNVFFYKNMKRMECFICWREICTEIS